MSIDFSNVDSIVDGFSKVLNLSNVGSATQIPAPLILQGVPRRSGISAIKIAARIIKRKSEAGLSIGVLPSGVISPDEIMERIRVEEIIRGIIEDSVITVAIPPGTSLIAAGASPAGPVTVVGSTTTLTKGYGTIQ